MTRAPDNSPSPSSYRDPSGYIFTRNTTVYRQIRIRYKPQYDRLMQSGLYKDLTEKGLLVPHTEISQIQTGFGYKTIRPDQIPFISYPWEWCFSQMKDAAMLTLEITRTALNYGMILKDATPFNVQFIGAKPVFIDTLSFDLYQNGNPWIAYKQFCEQFLAPLAVAAYCDTRLIGSLTYPTGSIPLDLTVKLLPVRAKLNSGVLLHIFFHSMGQSKITHASKSVRTMSNNSLLGLLDSLKSTVSQLKLPKTKTMWTTYGNSDASQSYTPASFEDKKIIVRSMIGKTDAKTAWDIGANTGIFSRIAAEHGIYTLSMDYDPYAVETNYSAVKTIPGILPLVMNVTSPSAPAGWANKERGSLSERQTPDLILALALVHHLAIANNVPLELIAEYLAAHTAWLIIEFIPKSDKQVSEMLMIREDIFTDYTLQGFEKAFGKYFSTVQKNPIRESDRILYLYKRK